jgi:hypothetical protein
MQLSKKEIEALSPKLSQQEIEALSPCERVSLYIELSAKMALVGARLRNLNQWEDNDYDEWDAACDAVSACYFALSFEEIEFIKPIEVMLSCLDRGVWPVQKEPKTETCFYCMW